MDGRRGGRVCSSAEGADLALTAAPFAAGVGKAHNNVPPFPVGGAQGLQDFVGDERARRPGEHGTLRTLGGPAWCLGVGLRFVGAGAPAVRRLSIVS